VFSSLSPGTYTAQVTDNCNTSVTKTFTITGSYTTPSISITSQAPSCPSSSDGFITVTATNGRAPLTYALISPSPVTVGPQAGNSFTGLPAGSYTVQVKDSCGNFQTQTVNLTPTPSTVLVIGNNGNSILQYISCDSFAVYLTFNYTNYKPPYTITATLPNGSTVTQVLTAPVTSGGSFFDTLYIHYAHVTGSTDLLPLTVTNACGVSNSGYVTLSTGFDMTPDSTVASVCGNGYTYTFDEFPNLHCSTVTYTLVSPAGVVLATQTNNSTFAGYPAGVGYKVIRQDCCSKDTLQFTWSATPPFQITYTQGLSYATCEEGTMTLFITYNYNDLATVVLESGPSSVTLASGLVQPYTYPDTATNIWNGDIIGYFGPGTYELVATDNVCGQKDSVTVTVGPGDVRATTFDATLEKGCNNANKILLSVVNNQVWTPGTVTVNSTTAQLYNVYDESAATSYSDSVQNLPAGTYYASYQFSNYYGIDYFKGMSTWPCSVYNDTIVIPSYTQPSFSPAPAVVLCGSTREVALIPDSTTGVQPYQYEITAGPSTTALQSSPVFTGLGAGTYTFLMEDACDNSFSRNITVDTLAIPTVVTTGSTCVGSNATFVLPASPFYSYSWQYPNGTTATGDSLVLDPVTSADVGTYTLSLTSTVSGCTNTTSKSLILYPCQVLLESLLDFSGQWAGDNIQLAWKTTDELNASYYVVERSTDGYAFVDVQRVAAGGVQNTYTVTDTHVPAGTVYYRLQTVENSGVLDYSNIITFSNDHPQAFNVYPRLVTSGTPVTVTLPASDHAASIRVISVDGKVWLNVPVAAGIGKTEIDASGLATGVYFVVFTGNGGAVAAEILKE
jgi:hypothetical protein